MFGSLLRRRRRKESRNVTLTQVESLVARLRELKGVFVEGIFRQSGALEEVNSLYRSIRRGKSKPLAKCKDVHVIAGALKLVLRSMPAPLLTFELYDSAIEASHAVDERIQMECVKLIVSRLPDGNKAILRELLSLLSEIHKNRDKNLMPASNLGTVFAPSILRPEKENSATALTDAPHLARFVAKIIEWYDIIFNEKSSEFPTPSTSGPSLQLPSEFEKLLIKGTIRLERNLIREALREVPDEKTKEEEEADYTQFVAQVRPKQKKSRPDVKSLFAPVREEQTQPNAAPHSGQQHVILKKTLSTPNTPLEMHAVSSSFSQIDDTSTSEDSSELDSPRYRSFSTSSAPTPQTSKSRSRRDYCDSELQSVFESEGPKGLASSTSENDAPDELRLAMQRVDELVCSFMKNPALFRNSLVDQILDSVSEENCGSVMRYLQCKLQELYDSVN